MKQKYFTNHSLDLRAKKKDKQWYMNYMETHTPYNVNMVPDYDRIISNSEIYNGNLDSIKKNLKKFCDPADIMIKEEDIMSYPKLYNNVNILKGEKLKRNENFKVLILSAQAIKDKNEKLLEALTRSIDERVLIKIEEQKAMMEGMEPSQVEDYIKQLKTQEEPEDLAEKNFMSEYEIFYSKALKFCKNDQDTKTKEMMSLEDAIVQDRFFVYVGFEYGKPCIKLRNVASTIYNKPPDEFRVHRGNYLAYLDAIDYTDALTLYGDQLSEEELDSLSNHSRYNIKDRRHNVLQGKAEYIRNTMDDEILHTIGNNNTRQDKGRGMHQDFNHDDELIWRCHLEFKAFKEVFFLTYTDPLGERVTIIIRGDYEIPKGAEKIKFTNSFGQKTHKFKWMEDGSEYEAEPIYIPRKYEVTRLNGDIYVNFREVPFQVTNMENPFSEFELSTKGAVLTSRNAQSISLFERALPLYMQYLYVKHIQNRELSKYQGYIQDIDVDQIPHQLGKDVDGNKINDPIQVSLFYQRTLGKNFFSGSQSSIGGFPNPTQSPGSQSHIFGTANEIFNLESLLELISKEMGMVMGISPQRASEFSSNTNVTDNQQAIAQSHHITEPLFYLNATIWKDIYKEYLKCFRTYAERILLNGKDEHTLSYILPDGTKELFTITRKSVELVDLALFVTNTGQEQEYLNLMKNLAQPLSQNQGQGTTIISSLLKAITSGASPEEVHKQIQIEERKQEVRMREQEQASLDAQERLAKKEDEKTARQYAHEKEITLIETASKEKVAAMNNTARQEEKDSDGDGEPDYIELLKLGKDVDIKDKELVDKEKQRQHEKEENAKDRNLKEKEIKSKPKPQK